MKRNKLIILIGVTFFLSLFLFSQWHQEMEYKFLDFKSKFIEKKKSDSIISIIVTKNDIELIKQYPVSEKYWALLVDLLNSAGANSLVFDIFFSPYVSTNHPLLNYAFKKSTAKIYSGLPLSILKGFDSFPYHEYIYYGYSNIKPSRDGIIRSIPLFEGVTPSLCSRLAQKKQKLQDNCLLVSPLLNLDDFESIHLTEAIHLLKSRENHQRFKNKVIFIGYHLPGVSPFFKNTGKDDLISGLAIQMNFTNALLMQHYYQEFPSAVSNLIAIILIFAGGFLATFLSRKKSIFYLMGLLFFFYLFVMIMNLNLYHFSSLYPGLATLLNFIVLSFVTSYYSERKLFKEVKKDHEMIRFILEQFDGHALLFNGQLQTLFSNQKYNSEKSEIIIQTKFKDKISQLKKLNTNHLIWEEQIGTKTYSFTLAILNELRNITGQPLYLLLSYNVTKIINLQSEIKEKEHLASIGQMSAEIAHEIRNPLAGLELSALSIQEKIKDRDDLTDYISNMLLAIKGLNRFVTEFLEFSKDIVLQKREVKLKKIIDDSVFMIAGELGKRNLNINSVEDDSLYVDSDRIRQVIINVLHNAIHATQENGEISIEIIGQKKGYYQILIKDNGKGIDEKNLLNIFNPFFTTRAEGIGLGLSISKRIVNLDNGKMEIESELGKGTSVKIILPKTREQVL